MYHRILVVLTDHPASQVALAHALGLAKALQAGLLFTHVLRHYPLTVADMPPVVTVAPDDFERQTRDQAHRLLDRACEQASSQGVAAQSRLLQTLDGVDGITATAQEQACDLIIVGAEGGNAVMRLLTGSAIPGLITRAAVPVMVCHAHDAPPPD